MTQDNVRKVMGVGVGYLGLRVFKAGGRGVSTRSFLTQMTGVLLMFSALGIAFAPPVATEDQTLPPGGP